MAGPSIRHRHAVRPPQVAVLPLLLATATAAAPVAAAPVAAAPAATSGAALNAAVTAATGQLRQAWAADPTTAALPFPTVRLLQPGASLAGTCNPKAPPRRPAATAAFCLSSGEVLLDQDLLADAFGKAQSSQGGLLVGGTATPTCDTAELAALGRGAVPDPALLAKIEQLPPAERAHSSLLGAINSQCRPLPKRQCPRSIATK
jgi:hypothetical protein